MKLSTTTTKNIQNIGRKLNLSFGSFPVESVESVESVERKKKVGENNGKLGIHRSHLDQKSEHSV